MRELIQGVSLVVVLVATLSMIHLVPLFEHVVLAMIADLESVV